MIDPHEIEEIYRTLREYDEAYVNLIQAVKRVLILVQPETTTQEGIRQEVVTGKGISYSGDPCKRCGQFALVRTGSCLTCQACGNNDSCG